MIINLDCIILKDQTAQRKTESNSSKARSNSRDNDYENLANSV